MTTGRINQVVRFCEQTEKSTHKNGEGEEKGKNDLFPFFSSFLPSFLRSLLILFMWWFRPKSKEYEFKRTYLQQPTKKVVLHVYVRVVSTLCAKQHTRNEIQSLFIAHIF
jgi:hypothetical protein